MEGKKVSDSAIVMPVRMMPQHANPAGNVHGGEILRNIDLAAASVAIRHAGCPVVTVSIDRMEFLAPARVGELVHFKASLNMVGTTSMEIGVRVESEDMYSGEIRHTGSAYLTFVAVEDGKSRPVPPLILENEDEKRRFREAQERRKTRRAEKQREIASQHGPKDK